MRSWRRWIAAEPHRMVLFLILAQLTVWTAVPALFHTSLPLDVVREGLAWGREWQWGYHKHPPLTSWLIELSFEGLGDVGPFLLSQLAVAATYFCVYRLGRELMDAKCAALGTLLLAGNYYFSFPAPEFNQNVAQMPVWACVSLAFYKATHGGGRGWWLLLGAAVGVGMLIKYSVAVLVVAMLLYMSATPATWSLLATANPYVSAAVAVATAAPHLWWLQRNGFVTLDYAVSRAGHSIGWSEQLLHPVRFLGAQVADHLGTLALLALSGFIGRGALRHRSAPQDDGLRFLVFMGILPALLVAFGSLVSGFGLRDMWGAPMWNLSGLLAVKLCRARLDRVSATRLIGGVAAFLLVVPAIYGVAATIGRPGPRGPRTAWPDRAIAATFSAGYRDVTGCPVRLVAGSGWLAGLVAMRSPGRPSVLLDGDFAITPWVTPERVEREGLLAVWLVGSEPATAAAIAAIPHLTPIGTKEFAWPWRPPSGTPRPPLTIGWGVVPPRDRSGCDSPSPPRPPDR